MAPENLAILEEKRAEYIHEAGRTVHRLQNIYPSISHQDALIPEGGSPYGDNVIQTKIIEIAGLMYIIPTHLHFDSSRCLVGPLCNESLPWCSNNLELMDDIL